MKRRTKRVIAVAVGEVLMAGILLLTFAFFHHVLPRMRAPKAPVSTVNVAVTPTPAPTPEPVVEATPEPTEEPDTRTEWQKKFAEHFSDEVVITENSYKSPEVSVTVTEHRIGEGNQATVYFVMDIYVAQIENFRTCMTDDPGSFDGSMTMAKSKILDMVAEHNAIGAVNGDFYSYQRSGVMVRNGAVYRQNNIGYDICVLFMDGTMETYRHNEYSDQMLNDLIQRGIWQAWQFGPELLGDNGEPDCSFNTSQAVQFPNPRTAVGYFEPGHYCFLTADGRQDGYSYGLRLDEMAQIFSDMGCKAAYNLDGGGSAVMSFNGDYVNRQSNGGDREISDYLLITEVEKEG